MTELTPTEREAMCHAFGLSISHRTPVKNAFRCTRESHWHGVWVPLVRRELATMKNIEHGCVTFTVTEAGSIALLGMTLADLEKHRFSSHRFSISEIHKALGLPPRMRRVK